MIARDLAQPLPSIGLDDDALLAVRLMADDQLPALVVCDPAGRPTRLLSGPQVLEFVVPPYVRDDVALARVMGEEGAEELLRQPAGRTVRDLLPRHHGPELVVAAPEDTLLELCVLMARAQSPLVAVVEDGRLVGCVTLSRLLGALLAHP